MILTILNNIERTKEEDSFDFSNRVVNELKKQGFEIKKEKIVSNRGDGRKGRIDLIASIHGEEYAIELDRKTPRKKSIYKLMNYPCAGRFIVLRDTKEVIVL